MKYDYSKKWGILALSLDITVEIIKSSITSQVYMCSKQVYINFN